MIEIQEVRTGRQRREFLNFPLRLYKDCKYFVPPLYSDEKKIFDKDYVYYETCEAVYYLAVQNGKTVGRISGIIQKTSNELRNEKRVRFTRFDSINDAEVAKALFDAVEKWALQKGMNTVVGPLGFSDLEREGLLVEKGFDQLSTFEEQYNYEYYASLIESCGYVKEVDWLESRIYPPEDKGEDFKKTAQLLMKRYNLRYGTAKNTKEFLKKYADGFFEILDKSYAGLYGTVPFTDSMKKMLIENFKLVINIKHVCVVVDENDKVICMGLCFPSLAQALQKSSGHLTPAALIRVLKAIKHPEIIDFGLIGVDPEYENRGVSILIFAKLIDTIINEKIEHAETNLNLEDNYNIRNLWKRFGSVEHKRRRSYMKEIG